MLTKDELISCFDENGCQNELIEKLKDFDNYEGWDFTFNNLGQIVFNNGVMTFYLTLPIEKPETVYKLQNPEGLFSTGTRCPVFKKTGKIWKRLQDVKSHLRQFKTYCHSSNKYIPNLPLSYIDCSIVTYEIIPVKKERIDSNRNGANS